MRRGIHQVEKGIAFAAEWPEYHVECGEEDCTERALLTHLGEASSRKEAEHAVKERGFADGGKGWKKVKGKWYCALHDPTRSAFTMEAAAVLANKAGVAIDAMLG